MCALQSVGDQMLEREAKCLALMNSPHVVRSYGRWQRCPGSPLSLVTELCDCDLGQWIESVVSVVLEPEDRRSTLDLLSRARDTLWSFCSV